MYTWFCNSHTHSVSVVLTYSVFIIPFCLFLSFSFSRRYHLCGDSLLRIHLYLQHLSFFQITLYFHFVCTFLVEYVYVGVNFVYSGVFSNMFV